MRGFGPLFVPVKQIIYAYEGDEVVTARLSSELELNGLNLTLSLCP